jgi:hypothetical protein
VQFFYVQPLTAQQIDYTSSISAFKTKYPKADVVAVNYTEEYNFSLDKSKPQIMVAAAGSYQQTLVSLKDFVKSTDGLFYDDESTIENIKASSAKNKSIKRSHSNAPTTNLKGFFTATQRFAW